LSAQVYHTVSSISVCAPAPTQGPVDRTPHTYTQLMQFCSSAVQTAYVSVTGRQRCVTDERFLTALFITTVDCVCFFLRTEDRKYTVEFISNNAPDS